jgi:hypothetical protein
MEQVVANVSMAGVLVMMYGEESTDASGTSPKKKDLSEQALGCDAFRKKSLDW